MASRDAWAQTVRTLDLADDFRARSPVTAAQDAARASSASAPVTTRARNQVPEPEPLVPTIAPPEIFKTELCPRWVNGICGYGLSCQFAHGEHELRQRPRPASYKTDWCKNILKMGVCRYGSRCMFIHGEGDGVDLPAAHVAEPQPPPTRPAATPWPRAPTGASAGLPPVRGCLVRQQLPFTPIKPIGKRPMLCAPVVDAPSAWLMEAPTTPMSKSMRKHPLPSEVSSGSSTEDEQRTLPTAFSPHIPPRAAVFSRQSPTAEDAAPAPLASMLWTLPANCRPTVQTDTDIVATYAPDMATARTKGVPSSPLNPLRSMPFAVSPTRRSIRAGPCAVFYSNADATTTASQTDIGFVPAPPIATGSGSFFSTADGAREPLAYYHSLIATDATPAHLPSLDLLIAGKENESFGAACDYECGLTRRRAAHEFRCGTGRASLGAVASSMASWVLTSE